jgi:hypothetical protein
LSELDRKIEGYIAGQIKTSRVVRDTTRFARTTRPTGSKALQRSMDYVALEAVRAGWTVHYEQGYFPDWQQATRNLVLERPGYGPKASRFVVEGCAHLDSVPEGPGADDNAASVAAALEAVRVLGQVPLRNDVRIRIFEGEEQGLYGSFGTVIQRRHDLHRTAAMVDLEMVGAHNQKTAGFSMGGRHNNGLTDELARVAKRNDIPLVNWNEHNKRSDHLPYDWAGVPSAMLGVKLGETPEVTRQLDPFYHSAKDTPDKLNRQVLEWHTKLFALALNDMANATSMPPNHSARFAARWDHLLSKWRANAIAAEKAETAKARAATRGHAAAGAAGEHDSAGTAKSAATVSRSRQHATH